MRFFFDYKTKDQSLHDYKGDEFRSPQSAREYAEEIVQHLKHSLSGEWIGWRVEVHDASGAKYFSLPVDPAGGGSSLAMAPS
jgi:hypothetical protein